MTEIKPLSDEEYEKFLNGLYKFMKSNARDAVFWRSIDG